MQSATSEMSGMSYEGSDHLSEASTITAPERNIETLITDRLNDKLIVFRDLEELQFDNSWIEKINSEGISQAKTLMYDSFVRTLQDHEPEVSNRSHESTCEEIENELLKYSEYLDTTLDEVQIKIAEAKKISERWGEQSSKLKMMQVAGTVSQGKVIKDAERKARAADMKFSSYKKLLNDILEEVFPNKVDLFIPLMRDLTEAAFDSEEPYCDLSNYDEEIVNLLLLGRLIKSHPYDAALGRLVV